MVHISLSLCMMTRGPASRVRQILELWRPRVDEVVLAVDADGDAETLPACSTLIDRAFRFETGNDWYLERGLAWLYRQCRGKWAIRVDDDEIPSRRLLERLPILVDSDYRCVHLPRRWLFPDRGQYIVDPPWLPDWQDRLVQNDSRRLAFTGKMHTSVETMGPRHFAIDLPLYHADCLVRPHALRREKASSYERFRPRHANRGFPVNQMYTPEECGPLHTAPVPDEDRDLIRRVLEPRDVAHVGTRPVRVETVSPAEIARHLSTPTSHTVFRVRRAAAKLRRLILRTGR
jgi:hypothetical protein